MDKATIIIDQKDGTYTVTSSRGGKVYRSVTLPPSINRGIETDIKTAFKAAENMLGEILYWETC